MRRFVMVTALVMSAIMGFAQLPDVTLKDINGKSVNVSKLSNNGKPIVVSFWATWCKPCIRELKAIHEVYPDWQDETGVKVVIVSIDEAQNAQKVKPLVDGFGWEYDVLLDSNGELKRLLNIQSVPYVLVLDGKGKIVYNHTGYTDGGEEELYKIIKKL